MKKIFNGTLVLITFILFLSPLKTITGLPKGLLITYLG